MLILVRHALPAYGPDVAADQWPLSRDGHDEARLLAATLPAHPYLVASAERKAWQTLEPAGQVVRDRRFNEVSRVEPWEGEFRQLRRQYVDGVDHPDWEPRSQVAERFGDAVDEHSGTAQGRPVVVATHGMAVTLWLTARIGLSDPGAFWADLRFPDAHLVDLAARTVVRLADRP